MLRGLVLFSSLITRCIGSDGNLSRQNPHCYRPMRSDDAPQLIQQHQHGWHQGLSKELE